MRCAKAMLIPYLRGTPPNGEAMPAGTPNVVAEQADGGVGALERVGGLDAVEATESAASWWDCLVSVPHHAPVATRYVAFR